MNRTDSLNSERFLSFVARYKFTLAFENAVCEDYITEKLWRPLIVGSVPIYYGSPSFKDWLPNNNSAISVMDYSEPKQLAQFLNYLHQNNSEYTKYLNHKLSNSIDRISNKQLLKALKKRKKDIPNRFENYVEAFQCYVCQQVFNSIDSKKNIITRKMYDCPFPKNPLTGQLNRNNFWFDQWKIEKCSARLLATYVMLNTTINQSDFEKKKLYMYDNSDC